MAVLVPKMDVGSVAVGVVVVADSGGTEVAANMTEVARDPVVSLDEEDEDEDMWFLDNALAMPPPTPAPIIRIVPMANTQNIRGVSPHIRSRWRCP